jgi:hypothetical protein
MQIDATRLMIWRAAMVEHFRVLGGNSERLLRSIGPGRKALSPKPAGVSIDTQLLGDSLIGFSSGALEDDLTPLNHLLRRAVSAHPLFQYLSLGVLQLDGLQ